MEATSQGPRALAVNVAYGTRKKTPPSGLPPFHPTHTCTRVHVHAYTHTHTHYAYAHLCFNPSLCGTGSITFYYSQIA